MPLPMIEPTTKATRRPRPKLRGVRTASGSVAGASVGVVWTGIWRRSSNTCVPTCELDHHHFFGCGRCASAHSEGNGHRARTMPRPPFSALSFRCLPSKFRPAQGCGLRAGARFF